MGVLIFLSKISKRQSTPVGILDLRDSFSIIHALAYSFIGFQTAYAATRWNPIYWNTANLIVNSGSLEGYENEDDDEEAKEKQTDYAKMAKALGDILTAGIKISLVDINKSSFSFQPDIDNNQILFGLKALSGVNSDAIERIIAGRPYVSLSDFMTRCPLNKTQMISLIKGGAFDALERDWARELKVNPRLLVMALYLSRNCDAKQKLTLQNFNGLIQKGLVPESLDYQRKVFEFNKYLKANTKIGKYFVFDDSCLAFYERQEYDPDHLEIINGYTCILQKTWDNIYQKEMDGARDWLKANQTQVLEELNTILFHEAWDKYAKGSISAWEMESLCFYYHDHELANVDTQKYGITNFFTLPTEPEVDYYFARKGVQIPIYKTHKIIGTVISKNDNKATISLLTTSGVVTVKFTKEYYAMFKKQISEKQEDGTKKVVEKGWFKRGTMLMLTGFRRGDMFVTKTYKHTPTHQIYKIDLSEDGRDLILTHERIDTEE